MFRGFGYSEQVATVLGLLTTEPPRMPVVLDGERLWVALGERVLPQGACTSPAITNILCRRLDRRLEGIARRHGFRYTRYADDLTFSGSDRGALGHLLGHVRRVIGEEGFSENEAKARAMGSGGRQEVTGVVVNERVTVSRKEVRRLRALLHNAREHGLESQNRAGHPSFLAHLRGRIAFVAMVDPKKAEPLRQALEALLSS
jgi:retron-type reverse transcriptase